MTTESPESNPNESSTVESAVADTQAIPGTASDAQAVPPSATTETEEGDAEVITDPKLMDRYECRACGYIYEPVKGDDSSGIDAGVPFAAIYDSWKCPVCSAPKRRFNNIGPAGNPSGFRENLGYGLGVNTMTPGQKNILIFGALLLGFLFFMSLYGLN